jgi:alpha-beta hydrolase superfamily lysophospholipase
MDVNLRGLHAQLDQPPTRKFAWPIVLIPELFATTRHLAILAGYLVSIGWEVYTLDPHPRKAVTVPAQVSGGSAFSAVQQAIQEALSAIDTDVVTVGHGLGGLLALKVAESKQVRAAVALAPLVPGLRSSLFVRRRAFWRSDSTGLPVGRRLLELVADADPFQREAIIKSFVDADTSAAMEVARGEVEFAPHPVPRLIVAGDADDFAPRQGAEQFALQIGAHFLSLPGRGHWLIAGRTLERAIAEMQRFLVRALGEQLLLLYSERDRDDSEDP